MSPTTKEIEIYSPSLRRKIKRLMTNILKEIGIMLRIHGKELKPLFL